MGKLLVKLIAGIMTLFEHDEKLLKNARVPHDPDSWWNWIGFPGNLFKNIDADTVSWVTTAYVKGACYSIAIILIIMIIYLVTNVARWRRARVFVSYQHRLEDVATGIAERLKNKHLNPIKLPFLDSPEHNSLLDEVKTRISKSDLVVCIPGEKPSFVENEVAMAFAMEKPLVFVSTNEYLSRIPNTAKHGYPIVNLNSLDEGGWNSFCNFCIYVTGYNISLINMCICVITKFFRILGTFVLLYILVFLSLIILADRVTVSQNLGSIENAIIIPVVTQYISEAGKKGR
jgi:hypothetical protein